MNQSRSILFPILVASFLTFAIGSASAQSVTPESGVIVPPTAALAPVKIFHTHSTPFQVMVGTFSALQAADMLTTAYTLTHPAPGMRAVEANPFLRGLQGSPGLLATVSGAVSVSEVWALSRLRRNHPRLAFVSMTALAAVEGVMLANNLRVVNQLRAARR
jgi:hypothetical protein